MYMCMFIYIYKLQDKDLKVCSTAEMLSAEQKRLERLEVNIDVYMFTSICISMYVYIYIHMCIYVYMY